MADKVTFDGENKLIIVNNGITELEFRADVYSAWKEWVVSGPGARYDLAITAIGGDPINEYFSVGSTYFLENGWKIRPYEGNHRLTITGNIYTRDGSNPIVVTLGAYNVFVEVMKSTLVELVQVGVGSPAAVAQAVWGEELTTYEETGSAGKTIKNIDSNVEDSMGLIISK